MEIDDGLVLSKAVEFIYTNPPQPPPSPSCHIRAIMAIPYPPVYTDSIPHPPPSIPILLEPPQTPIGHSPSQHAIHLHRGARAAGRTRNAKNTELDDADESNAPAIRLASRVNLFCAREAPGPVRHHAHGCDVECQAAEGDRRYDGRLGAGGCSPRWHGGVFFFWFGEVLVVAVYFAWRGHWISGLEGKIDGVG